MRSIPDERAMIERARRGSLHVIAALAGLSVACLVPGVASAASPSLAGIHLGASAAGAARVVGPGVARRTLPGTAGRVRILDWRGRKVVVRLGGETGTRTKVVSVASTWPGDRALGIRV